VVMAAIPTVAMVVMAAIPTAATMILGHHPPTPTVATPITRKTYRCTVTATTTHSAIRRTDRKKGWTKMQDDRHCKDCGHLLAMHDRDGCTATFPKYCKCGGAIK
jgi:hypothetical protein